ncbi:MAG: hypothetical protein KGZ58_11650 [Ignavibacteriales bacterium]|nr:hypothetical protein [Ignavibacteriales bacterium]
MDIQFGDLGVILLLVFMEGLLSADNAIVLAVLALPLPPEEQKKALKYGMFGAFFFRILAVVFVAYLMSWPWVKMIGGMYLMYLGIKHFHEKILLGEDAEHIKKTSAKQIFGLSQFWSTVIAIELTDIVFSVDSIFVAVAMSPKLSVIILGGVLGIIAMRFVAGGFLKLLKQYPLLVDAAYAVVLLIGTKLFIEFLHVEKLISWELPHWFVYVAIGVSFLSAFLFSVRKDRKKKKHEKLAEQILESEI